MQILQLRSRVKVLGAVVVAAAVAGACDEKPTPLDKNLLVNASFEEVGNGLPKRWKISNFRGLEGMKAAFYGVDDTISHDGERSFYFRADGDARRFYTLSQEVRVRGANRVRLQGRVKSIGVEKRHGQYPQANLALTYYDESRERFVAARFADVGTEMNLGTSDGWTSVDEVYPLPRNTAFVVVHCVLGASGQIWFDDLSLQVPSGLPWQQAEGELFTHYWLQERPYPEGSIDYQMQLYDYYAGRLGIPRENQERIMYYFYPDTTLLRETMGITGHSYVDYKRRQIHSIDPVDNHEIVHLLTDSYGVLPKVLSEGTAFCLMDDLNGEPIQPLAQRLLLAGELPTLETILHPFAFRSVESTNLIAAAASFVGYVLKFGGSVRFLELHRTLSSVPDYEAFAAVFEQVYGGPLTDAEAYWRRVLASTDFSEGEKSQLKP
ncbi:MAG: hypothetical protein OEN01_05515 [Candidatus Krumholzibacteria bacterium]|nr:hypothetical protein [Candidatus Krumholzibacteria bacterium]